MRIENVYLLAHPAILLDEVRGAEGSQEEAVTSGTSNHK